jgi:ubiquinone/menaquinone biosynthesis C-methylase UbiE
VTDSEYVLRPRDAEEITRLHTQHQVWQEPTHRVLAAAGFASGDRLLDLGCGPGYLTFDLAQIAGADGRVAGIDSSARFIAHLAGQIADRAITNIQATTGDLKSLDVGAGVWDGGICRWVLMFIDEPERVLRNVARALRPGGTFAAMEYFQFQSMSLWPAGRQFKELYGAVHTLITRSGGDPNIGSRLPELLVNTGFEIVDLLPILRVGRPGTPMWDWMKSHNQNHTNLVDAGLLTDQDLQAYYAEFGEHSTNPAAFFTAPPVLATIARKL